jgi:hypothetical protein
MAGIEPIPQDWVDKLFNCMSEFYGERWTASFNKPHMESFYKTMWRNGLTGLTYDQIKYQLQRCKRHAMNPTVQPPIVTEFYKFARGDREPHIDYHPKAGQRGDPNVARAHLDSIRARMGAVT